LSPSRCIIKSRGGAYRFNETGREVHDIPVDYIVTPEAVIETHTSLPRLGIYWKLLPPEKIEPIPALRRMAARPPHLA
jgi:hypothetical protein